MKTLSADMAALCRQIRSEAQVAIALHENPDHDAAGAAVGLRELFVQLGVPAEIHLSPDEHLPSHTFFLDDALLVRRMPPSGATLYVLDTGSLARTALAVESWKGDRRQHRPPSRQHALRRRRLCARRGQQHGRDHLRRLRRARRGPVADGRHGALRGLSRSTRVTSATAARRRTRSGRLPGWSRCGADPAAVYRELYERRSLEALRLWARAVANTTHRRRRARPGEPAHDGRLRSRRCRRGRDRGDRRLAARLSTASKWPPW